MDKSGNRKEQSDRGALTAWRVQIDGQVRTRKGTERPRGTHKLESADRWASQDTERNRATEGHSRPGECRSMDKSGHRKEQSDRGALTSWRVQIDGQVRTQKGTERPRGTHILESADRWTSQDTERNRATEGHSQTGECRLMDKSGHGKEQSDRGALTTWRVQIDGQVRTRKGTEGPGGTHQLESADRWTSQDTERNRATEGHSLSGECRSMDKLGHRKEQSD